MARVASILLLRAAAASAAMVGCVKDAHGCCASAGYFWCASSGRCTHDWDQCEDAFGENGAPCGFTSLMGGAAAAFDLSGLTITKGRTDHVANASRAGREPNCAVPSVFLCAAWSGRGPKLPGAFSFFVRGVVRACS